MVASLSVLPLFRDYNQGGKLRGSIDTGHIANIFCAQFLPSTGSSRVISCAGDREIRCFNINYGSGNNNNNNDNNINNNNNNNNTNNNKSSPKKFDYSQLQVYRCHRGRVKKVN